MEFDFKSTGFRFVDENTVEFYCDGEKYVNFDGDEDVYVSGSFNSWVNTADSAWKMERKVSKNSVYFVMQKPLSQVMVPGNTGYPEFRFYALSDRSTNLLVEKKQCADYSFIRNKLILKNPSEVQEIKTLNENYIYEKTLSDFDLDCPACRSDISNVRLVPGTACLFRGYNPFKRSRNEMDTEDERIALVQKAYRIFGVKSDITLSGNEGANVLDGEVLPDLIKEIEAKGNRLCINIDYNLVYFHSDAFDFSVALGKISRFMISSPGPFYIHCRLGSDRTGVICAVFAALCGASWEDVALDYEKTSNMGICEYRNRRLLQYSLTKMLGKDPAYCRDLAHAVQSFFLKEKILTMNEIQSLIEKLNVRGKTSDEKFFDFSGRHVCGKKHA